MAALKYPKKNASSIEKLVVPGLLIVGLGLAGKLILFDLTPADKIAAIASFMSLSAVALQKIDDLDSDAETMVGYAVYAVEAGTTINFQINNFKNVDQQFDRQEKVFDEGLKATNNVIKAGVSVASAALSHLNSIKASWLASRPKKDLSSIIAKYRTSSPVMQELSQHLAHESTQKQLLALAKEACDHAMQKRSERQLETLGLTEKDTRYQFYTDVYLYLRVWLKNSIEYETEMPRLDLSIKDASLYVDAATFLLDERAAYFLSPGDQFTSPINDLLAVIQLYLGTLISRLRTEVTTNSQA